MTLEEHCNGCQKMVQGKCSVYADPWKKTGKGNFRFLGCAFSPTRSLGGVVGRQEEKKTRIGQQKSKKKSKQVSWRTYKSKNSTKLSRMKNNGTKT